MGRHLSYRLHPLWPVSHGAALGENNKGYYSTWVTNRVLKLDLNTMTDSNLTFDPLNHVISMPAISGNRIYVQAPRVTDFAQPGRLFAINTDTMDYDWFIEPGHTKDNNDWDHPGAIIGPDGSVLFGVKNTMWRLNAATGTPIWTRTGLGNIVRTARMTRDDESVIVAHGNNLEALDFATGATKWVRNLESVGGAPSVAPNGRIIIGSQGGVIRCLNPDDGAILWSFTALGRQTGAAAFSLDGTIAYMPSWDNRLYAFNIATGTRQWTFTGVNEHRVSPIVGTDGTIYFANRLGDFYALRPDASEKWSFRLPGHPRGTFSIGPDGTLYVGVTESSGLCVIRQQAYVGGQITFQDRNGNYPSTVRLGIYESLSSDLIETLEFPVSENGSFGDFIALRPNFRILFDADGFLDRFLSVDVSTSGDKSVSVTLINGDANGDNAVSVADFLILRAAFGSSDGSPTWDARADFNGDGTVSVADFLILRKNFGMSGDAP